MILSVEQDLNQNYFLLDCIGSGGFGHLMRVQCRKTKKFFACKIQKNHGHSVILVQQQYQILCQLNETKKFPLVYMYKRLNKNSYMIMQLMSRDLQDLMQENCFSIKTVALIAEQMISSLEVLHESGYLHRDLKPQNMMSSIGCHNIKLVDFGLATQINPLRSNRMIGNVRYASRNAHLGYSSQKDDLESLAYVLYYLLIGRLPWQNIPSQHIAQEINRNVLSKDVQLTPIYVQKLNFSKRMQFPNTNNHILKLFYQQFASLLRQILTSERDLNYKNLLHRCNRLIAISGTEIGGCYDWCPVNCLSKTSLERYWQIYQLL